METAGNGLWASSGGGVMFCILIRLWVTQVCACTCQNLLNGTLTLYFVICSKEKNVIFNLS